MFAENPQHRRMEIKCKIGAYVSFVANVKRTSVSRGREEEEEESEQAYENVQFSVNHCDFTEKSETKRRRRRRWRGRARERRPPRFSFFSVDEFYRRARSLLIFFFLLCVCGGPTLARGWGRAFGGVLLLLLLCFG